MLCQVASELNTCQGPRESLPRGSGASPFPEEEPSHHEQVAEIESGALGWDPGLWEELAGDPRILSLFYPPTSRWCTSQHPFPHLWAMLSL